MTEAGRWNMSIYPSMERKVLIVTSCSIEVYLTFAPFHNWEKNQRGTHSFYCFSLNAQHMPSGVTKIFSNDSSTCEIPRALICLTNIFVFSKAACCLAS